MSIVVLILGIKYGSQITMTVYPYAAWPKQLPVRDTLINECKHTLYTNYPSTSALLLVANQPFFCCVCMCVIKKQLSHFYNVDLVKLWFRFISMFGVMLYRYILTFVWYSAVMYNILNLMFRFMQGMFYLVNSVNLLIWLFVQICFLSFTVSKM